MENETMSQSRVSNYCKIRNEIEILRERILSLEEVRVSDVVQSSEGAGWQKKNVVIEGYGNSLLPRLYARVREREAECDKIEAFIDSVKCPVMFQLLTLRYLEGNTVEMTAEIVGYSKNHAGVLIKKFFSENLTGEAS